MRIKKSLLHGSLFLFLSFFISNVKAQPNISAYKIQLDSLRQAVTKYFYDPSSGYYLENADKEKNKKPASYLWPLCGMIQADNEVEIVQKKKGLVDSTLNIIKLYYDPKPPAPGYASYVMKLGGGDRFYDDNQWIGIAVMDAYFRTKTPSYLETGKLIYRFMMTAYDTVGGGGLYWEEGKLNTKNTCSNGPGIILALQLYKSTQDKAYLDTALILYNWVNEKLRAPSGIYYDNVSLPSLKTDRRTYSYNTGTMMQSAVYLYEITKEKKYLDAAISIADSSMTYFYGNQKFRDGYWFNAVLLRAYQHLYKFYKDKKYLQAFIGCVNNALMNDKDNRGLMGRSRTVDLTNQAGMMEILARLAQLQN